MSGGQTMKRSKSADTRCGAGGSRGRCQNTAITVYERDQRDRSGNRVTITYRRCEAHPMNRPGRPISQPSAADLAKRARDEIAEAHHALGAARDYYREVGNADAAVRCANALEEITGLGLT